MLLKCGKHSQYWSVVQYCFLGILKNPLVFPDQKNTEANKERANKNEIAIFNGNFYI